MGIELNRQGWVPYLEVGTQKCLTDWEKIVRLGSGRAKL